MSRQLASINIGGNDYTLGFNRNSIKYTESVIGFNIEEIVQQSHVSMFKLFAGGLQMQHGELSIETREELLEQYRNEGGDVTEVIGFLTDSYMNFSVTTQEPIKKMKML